MQKADVNPLRRTEVIIINIGSNITTSHNFGQLPNLRKAEMIEKIESFDVSQIPLTPDNKTVVTNAVLKKSFLKLVELGGSNAEIHTLPLVNINQTSTNLNVKNINCQPLDFEKSTVNIPDTTGLAANNCFMFQVTYIKKP